MKRIVVNVRDRTEQHLVSGRVYSIDRRLERQGSTLWMERNYVRHETIAGVRSALLPEQNLWVLFFEGRGGEPPLSCYMHICRVLDQGNLITVEDLYLDVLIYPDGQWHLVDVDEFRQAIGAGELAPHQVQAALLGLENACRLVSQYGSAAEIELHLQSLLARA